MQDECLSLTKFSEFSCKTMDLVQFHCTCMFFNITNNAMRYIHSFPNLSHFRKWTSEKDLSPLIEDNWFGTSPSPQNIKQLFLHCKPRNIFGYLLCNTFQNFQPHYTFCYCVSNANNLPFTPSFTFNSTDIWSDESTTAITSLTSPNPDTSIPWYPTHGISQSNNSSHSVNHLHIFIPVASLILLMILFFIIIKFHKNLKQFTEKRIKFVRNGNLEIVTEL